MSFFKKTKVPMEQLTRVSSNLEQDINQLNDVMTQISTGNDQQAASLNQTGNMMSTISRSINGVVSNAENLRKSTAKSFLH